MFSEFFFSLQSIIEMRIEIDKVKTNLPKKSKPLEIVKESQRKIVTKYQKISSNFFPKGTKIPFHN